jgi:hypothetical protein
MVSPEWIEAGLRSAPASHQAAQQPWLGSAREAVRPPIWHPEGVWAAFVAR